MKRILQNSFSKTILCLLVALLSGGTAWAADEICYTLQPATGSNSSYTGNGNVTIDGIQWNVQGVNNTTPWQIGGVRLSGTNRSISSRTPLDKIINEVKLTLGNIEDGWGSFTVNSLTLTVASDANFSNVVDTKTVNSVGAGSTPTFTGNWPAGSYYKFTFNITTRGVNIPFVGEVETSDKYIQFSKAEFKGPFVDTPVISGTQVFEESTEVSISCSTSGATIQYTLDGGHNWHNYSDPFTLTQTTTVIAKATKDGMNNSHEATKTFCQKGDLIEVDWDLTSAPTGSQSNSEVTWTTTTTGGDFAVMTLEKYNSANNANAYLGGDNNHTRFYENQRLTVGPRPGYEIAYVEFICQTNSTSGLTGTWTNGTAVLDANKVTVTPTDLTASISKVISAETHVTGVNVYYFPVTSPYIAMVDIPIDVTSAEANGTLEVVYSDVDNTAAQVVVEGENNQAVTWLHVTPNTDNTVLSYSIDPNTTTASRVAYIKVRSGNTSSNRITVTQDAAIVLVNSGDNMPVITNNDGVKCCVILDSRSFSTGKWYTLCLPFDVTIANSPLAGADARELDVNNTRIEGKTLKLEFTPVTELKAGTPYIIRWESGSTIANPVFTNVTISKAKPQVLCELGNNRGVSFEGSYTSKTYDEIDQSKLFISNNTFYYVGVNTTIGAQRAYFQLYGFIYDTGAASVGGVKEFGITFLDEDPTGIEDVNDNLNLNDEPIYNIAGQRIQKMQRGINIVNGKKIFVK
ncbi:MAG: chitobiase/beta-hexosaminidase C-terminal domain-containing protein [Bacteroidaceae bacterium]|nr:chitobiase/beta-hexosaminidase C-terminal domain-containing protein [Bacteroidaceae bacterium]